jgi:Domain of unknown function (DUF4136)
MKNAIPYLLVLIILSGCYPAATREYQSEKTKGVDYKTYKTFAWLATKDTSYTKIAEKKKVEAALAAAVMQQLTKRGMVMDTLNPDCLFTYTLVLNKTYAVDQAPPEVYSPQSAPYLAPGQYNYYYYQPQPYYYDPNSYGGKISVTTFREGSLVIDMIDRKQNKIVWRTTAGGKVDQDEAKGVKPTINEIVPMMFKKFPVK